MDESLHGHCVVAINKTTVLVIGGENDNGISNKTHVYNFDFDKWYIGPELLKERSFHACGVFQNSTNWMIAVIGGENDQGEVLDSVEFAVLDEDNTQTMTWEWKYGPQFPFKLTDSTAVSSNSKLYFVGGTAKEDSRLNTIYELADNLTWIELPQKMSVARSLVAAIILPEDLNNDLRKS